MQKAQEKQSSPTEVNFNGAIYKVKSRSKNCCRFKTVARDSVGIDRVSLTTGYDISVDLLLAMERYTG